jgi:TRAP-type C4-dicarboxylate transport system permease small subunit
MHKVLIKVDEILYWAEICIVVPAMVVMIVVAFGQVVGRYFFNYAPAWCEEMARYLFIWVVFIGAPLGVSAREHMALRVLVDRLPDSRRVFCNLFVYAVAIVFLVCLAWQGIAIMIRTLYQVSPTLEISMRWVYAAIPIGSCLMLWHLLISLLKTGFADHPLFSSKG